MHVTARADLAVRALVEIAARDGAPVKADALAEVLHVNPKVLEGALTDARHAGLIVGRRGPDGGYRLSRAASEISVADVVRAVDGPLASVRGERPEALAYPESVGSTPGDREYFLRSMWVAVRASVRSVLEGISVGDVAAGDLPNYVADLTRDPDNWRRRT